ncbi:MAG TPA: cytochrome c oxidase subunit I [Balneolales bacterium]|nr:cytochrome c oxidase subunit I [Balneolales bacterium]
METAAAANRKTVTMKVRRYVMPEHSELNYLNQEKGIKSWLLTRDHKRIGLMYFFTGAIVFFVAGLIALTIRLELWTPAKTIIDAHTYNELFTLHGTLMIFFFLVPAVPGILGNFFIPLQIGAKDVAFPRLNLLSYYLYLTGIIFTVVTILTHGVDTGWTFYAPYSIKSTTAVIPMTTGIFITGFSSILTGLNFIVTIHKLRAPGLTWGKFPLFVWGIYATSIIQILATPVLAITLALLIMERLLHVGIFNPALGGDPVLYEHFFWFYSHPAVYIMIVPGFGIIADLIATFSHKRLFGYWFVAISTLAIAFLGFLVWGHHMFVAGQSMIASIVFSLLTFMIGIPTGIKIFNWLATMYKGSVRLKVPMLYALSFIFLFSIGGFTGVMLGALSVDVQLHATYYVVAHFHYVMFGGMVIALLGGIHFWWPKMFGKMYSETMARISWFLIFVGFNVTFFPQFILGAKGMPRRYYNYLPQFQPLHQLSTVGSWILALGFFIMLGYLLHSLIKGKKAPANPWDARTLEWMTSSPPPTENFSYTPVVIHGPYEYQRPISEFQLGLLSNGEHGGDELEVEAPSGGNSPEMANV